MPASEIVSLLQSEAVMMKGDVDRGWNSLVDFDTRTEVTVSVWPISHFVHQSWMEVCGPQITQTTEESLASLSNKVRVFADLLGLR